eukprot:768070-Hanusia_phi.AAC.1
MEVSERNGCEEGEGGEGEGVQRREERGKDDANKETGQEGEGKEGGEGGEGEERVERGETASGNEAKDWERGQDTDDQPGKGESMLLKPPMN